MSAKVKSRGAVRGEACKVLMAPGQVGVVVGDESGLEGHIVLRTYNQVVSLTDPGQTWTPAEEAAFTVEVLPACTSITYVSEV